MHWIQLSGLFAGWEAAKFLIGRRVMRERLKDPAFALLVVLFELPYAFWGVWLLFSDPTPAILIWGLTFACIAMDFRKMRGQNLIYRLNSAACVVILSLIFMGRM